MNENQPKSLAELKQDQTKLQNALVKAEIVRATIGGSNFSRHLQTSGKIGLERAVADQRAGDIQVLIETNAIPYLNSHLDSTQEQIIELEVERPRLITLWEDFLSEGSKLDGLYRNISRHVNEGRLSQSSLDNIIQLQTEHTVRGEMPDLVKAKAVWEESKAEESSQDIKKLEEEKEEETAVAVPKIEKPIVPVEPKTEERTILPDGQDVTDILRPKEKKLVAGLRLGSEENPIARDELARFVYGNDVELEIAIDRLYSLTSAVRKRLDPFGWEIANKTTPEEFAQGKSSEYYLRPKIAVAEEVAKPLPVIEVDLASRKVKVEGWKQSKQIGSQVDWAVFQCLVDSLKLGKPIARSQKLEKAAWEAGSKSKHVVKSSVHNLRSILEPDPKEPQIIIAIKNLSKSKVLPRGRKTVSYRLNAQIEFVGKPTEEEKVPPAPRTEEKAVSLEEIDRKIAIIEKAVATGAMPQSELVEAMRIRATLVEGAKNPEVENLPKMKIDESKRKVAIDGRVIQFMRSGLTFDGLVHIAKHKNKQISSTKLGEFIKSNGFEERPADLIRKIRGRIEVDTKYYQILKTIEFRGRNNAIYRLVADVEFVGEEKKQAGIAPEAKSKIPLPKNKEVTLPDGQVVKFSGIGVQTLEFFIANGLDESILSDDVAMNIYGSNDAKSRKNTSATISFVNKKYLVNLGWHIVNMTPPEDFSRGQKARYRLEKIAPDKVQAKEEESPTLAPTEGASIDIAAGPTESTIQAPNVPEDFIEVPFTLTEEERRSPEETKILQVITTLINRNSSQFRINFHEVISGLKSEIQMKIKPAPAGKHNIPIYSAEELKQKYSSALRKFREEQAIRVIKETWSDDEKRLWREITSAVNRFSWGDFEDFSRKVKTEIDRSQRQFYRDYPTSHGGNRVDWIQG